ncbi:hypothetical protein H7X65_03305 [Candidatus Parcubacteria bacterium]|nr:hypothetical protein [Candidatus Parcubacteria bacterium]
MTEPEDIKIDDEPMSEEGFNTFIESVRLEEMSRFGFDDFESDGFW